MFAFHGYCGSCIASLIAVQTTRTYTCAATKKMERPRHRLTWLELGWNQQQHFSLCALADSVQLTLALGVSMNGSEVNICAGKGRPLNSISLQNAVLCADCDVVSDSPHDYCLVCGSRSSIQHLPPIRWHAPRPAGYTHRSC